MTFEHYLAILGKRWKLIFLCVIILGLGTYSGSKLLTPLYQSSVLVQVNIISSNNQADYNSLLASDQLVQTEALLAVSAPVLQEVASHYPGLSTGQLAKEVSSSVKVNTQLLQIDVADPSPQRAAELANDIASTLIEQQLQVTQQNNNRAQQQIQQDIDATSAQIATITTKIADLETRSGTQAQVAALQIQRDGLQQHYNQWQTLLAQIELAQAQNSSFLRVAQSATPSTSPVRPQVLLYTAGGLLTGLLLGLLLALLFERLDTRVRTAEAVSQYLNWSSLATIWKAGGPKEQDAIINPTGNHPNAESFRILRTNLGFSAIDKPLRSIMVTSATPGEGKSTVAANLAIFMAKSGKKTVLVDADLRRSTQHDKFHIAADRQGLSNAILAFSLQSIQRQAANPMSSEGKPAEISLEPYLHSVSIPNLLVMPSGPLPPNPSELLDSKALERLFTTVTHGGIDMLIIDTPPLLGLSDASILSTKVDGAIVVVDITTANRGNLRHIKEQLTKTGITVLGYVVNKQRRSRKDSAYSYYYSYRPDNTAKSNKKTRPASDGHTRTISRTSLSDISLPTMASSAGENNQQH